MPVPTAMGKFLRDFEAFERDSVDWALHSLTGDTSIVQEGPPRLGLQARLTLLKRLSMARDVAKATLSLLDRVIEKSAHLQEKYAALLRIAEAHLRREGRISPNEYTSESPIVQRLRLPTDDEINNYDEETDELKRLIEAFVHRCAGNHIANSSSAPEHNRVHSSMDARAS